MCTDKFIYIIKSVNFSVSLYLICFFVCDQKPTFPVSITIVLRHAYEYKTRDLDYFWNMLKQCNQGFYSLT